MLITSFGDGAGSKLKAVKQLSFEVTVKTVWLLRRQLSSVSLAKRAEATYAEHRRQKASGSGGTWVTTISLETTKQSQEIGIM